MSAVELRWHSNAFVEFGQYIETIAPGRRKRSPMLRHAWAELFEAFRDRFPELCGVGVDEILADED
jgi:hypothetical protein